MHRATPRVEQGNKLDATFGLAHVPEIRLASIKYRFRPGPPDTVVMDMIWRKIVRDDLVGQGADGVQVGAALEYVGDFRAGERARFGLIFQECGRCLTPGWVA